MLTAFCPVQGHCYLMCHAVVLCFSCGCSPNPVPSPVRLLLLMCIFMCPRVDVEVGVVGIYVLVVDPIAPVSEFRVLVCSHCRLWILVIFVTFSRLLPVVSWPCSLRSRGFCGSAEFVCHGVCSPPWLWRRRLQRAMRSPPCLPFPAVDGGQIPPG